jgi:hypothetical protein
VAGTNITFSSNVNQITINGQAGGGGGDIVATDLTSTTMGLGSLGYLSTQQLTSSLGGLGSLGYISSTQLASTIVNLGQIYNSTILVAGTNITFTSNANQITINGQAGGGGGDVTAINLTSTTMGLGSLGYLSTQQLTSTTKGLGSLGYLSSISGFNSGTTYFLNWSQAGSTNPYKALQPTITGGSQQSDVNTIPTNTDQLIQTFQTPIIHPSFIPAGIWDLNLFVRSASSYLSVYYKIFKLNDGTSTQIGQNSLPVTIFPADGSTIVQVILSIAVPYTILDDGEGDTVYIQIRGVNSDLSFTHELIVYYEGDRYSHVHTTFLQSVTELSTISGLGSLGYISTASLFSSIEGLGTYGYISSLGLESTIEGLGSLGYISSLGLESTIEGLGTLGYLSSFTTISSANLSSGSVYASLLSSQQITASSITANKFVGDGSLITNVPNLGVTSITAGTGIGVNTTTGGVTVSNTGIISIEQGDGISITGSEGSYTITATGGTAGTVAAADLVSTVIGIQLRATSSLTSSLQGLSYMGYLSSFATISSLNISTGSIYASLLSSQQITVSSIRANKFVGDGSLLVNVPGTGGLATTDLTSTVTGLGTSGYLSSLTLLSTIENLGQIYNSTILVAGTNITFSSNMNQITINGDSGGIALPALVSSIEGLGTLQYVSSTQLISSIEGLGFMGNLQLTSSIEGLGSMLYLSSFNVLSTLNMSSGSVFTSTMSTTETNAGRLNFGELYNNGTKLVDANGNILFSFQTL